ARETSSAWGGPTWSSKVERPAERRGAGRALRRLLRERPAQDPLDVRGDARMRQARSVPHDAVARRERVRVRDRDRVLARQETIEDGSRGVEVGGGGRTRAAHDLRRERRERPFDGRARER